MTVDDVNTFIVSTVHKLPHTRSIVVLLVAVYTLACTSAGEVAAAAVGSV